MPDYLVIETTGGRDLHDGAVRVFKGVKDETEAVSLIVAESPYHDARTFKIFDTSTAVTRDTEDSKTTVILDKSDPANVRELLALDEQAILELKAERAAAEEAAKLEDVTGAVEVDVRIQG